MEPDQVNILARSVLRNLEQIDNPEEAGLSCQLRSDIRETYRLNGVHFNFTFFHPVSPSGLDMREFPDSNAARDLPAPNSLAQTLRKDHEDEFTRTFAAGTGPNGPLPASM
jgi:hypothetical protein